MTTAEEPAGGAEGPLGGVRVLDLSTVVMGPYATQVLGDLGADVIVIEGATLETNRVMGPGPHPQLSGTALNLMRNKRSVRIDFKHPQGREALLRIAASCDVVITNLRPSALRRAGLLYEDLASRRPDIVYCEAHGWPSDSERADDPAYDDVIQAGTGVADAFLRQTGSPSLVPTIFVDKLCGLTIAYAVIAALFERERTGRGKRIEVPMSAAAAAFILVEHGAGAIPEPPTGPPGYSRILSPYRRPQRTADGWIHVLPYSRSHYEAVFASAPADLRVDPELYGSARARIANADRLYTQLHAVLATRSTGQWMAYLRAQGVPATEITSLDDLVAGLPLAEHPVVGNYRQIPPPVRFGGEPDTTRAIRRPAPLVGEHTEEVLAEVGLGAAEVTALRELGAIPPDPEDR